MSLHFASPIRIPSMFRDPSGMSPRTQPTMLPIVSGSLGRPLFVPTHSPPLSKRYLECFRNLPRCPLTLEV